jgi:L-alanine-DL-glutamate epimerase-like enolase superfamily enzyme
MKVHLQTFTIQPRSFPCVEELSPQQNHLFLRVEHDGIEGWGVASSLRGNRTQTIDDIARSLQKIAPLLISYHPTERQKIARLLDGLDSAALPSAARSALDLALYDWFGKALNLPLYAIWGLDLERIGQTAATVELRDIDGVRDRTRDWLTQIPELQELTVKLGSESIESDKAMFLEVKNAAPHLQSISVDASGGWTLSDALHMHDWLTKEGVTYIEQPIALGHEKDLLPLYERSAVPIFTTECRTSRDIADIHDRVHGITIKLSQCGGFSEALKMIHTARAHGLKVKLGCHSDGILMNTALSHLAPLADYLDISSHLNFKNDPFEGATLVHGRLIPNDRPGLGVQRRGRG